MAKESIGDVAQTPPRRLLVFHVRRHGCALPVDVVEEILPMASLSRPATALSIVEGFLNIEGEVMPVLRLSRLLGCADVDVALYTPIIITRYSGGRLGLLVSDVSHVTVTTKDSLITLCDHNLTEQGVKIDGGIAPVLDMDQLLLVREQQQLLELQEIQERRLSELSEQCA